jgi:hypothetical protein
MLNIANYYLVPQLDSLPAYYDRVSDVFFVLHARHPIFCILRRSYLR